MEDSSRSLFFYFAIKSVIIIVNLTISYLFICYVWRDTGGPLWISLSDSQFPSDMIGRGGAKMLGNLKKMDRTKKI